MAKQAVTASPKLPPPPAIAPRVSMGATARVTGAAPAGDLPPMRSPHSVARADAPPKPTGEAPRVVKWGNGGPVGAAAPDDLPPSAALDDKGTEGAAVEGKPDKKAAKDDAETGTVSLIESSEGGEKTQLTQPQKPSAAERRSETLARLENERKTRELEETVKQLQAKLAGVEPVAKQIKEGTLVQRVKALGLSKADQAELLEKLLTKDPELLSDAPDKPAAAVEEPAYVKALRDTVEDLKKRLDGRDGSEQQAQVARATATISDMLKDDDLPLTQSGVTVTMSDGKTTDGHGLVLQVAHQMWLDSGKNGSPHDYVKRAGTRVEAHLTKQFPALAARLGGQQAARTEETAPAPARTGNPSLGRRGGKGAAGAPAQLPKDRAERDLQIKREMGWDY